MGAMERAVAVWVTALDGTRVRELLLALNRQDVPTAERVLGNAIGRPISLEDPLIREMLLDELEMRIAPEESSEDSETVSFPLHPVPQRDVRDEDATEEVDRVRRIVRQS